MVDTFIERLSERLQQPLPGRDAQYRMASIRRLQELGYNPEPPENARVACVLNLLHRRGDQWHTVLIQRTENPLDRHSGQVSFPGGRYEESDGDLASVALREAEEEIGVPAAAIQLIGRLTELYIPVSNYVVHPFVGVLTGEPAFTPQPGEVQQILTPALDVFTNKENLKFTDLHVRGATISNVPYFDVDGRVVWGATAMILSEFLEML